MSAILDDLRASCNSPLDECDPDDNLGAALDDVDPIPGGVPIRHIPHPELLMNLADEYGFREGFCKWAEAITVVYDHTAAKRQHYDVQALVQRANTLLDDVRVEREARRVLNHTHRTEFPADSTPVRETLEELISRVGLAGAVSALGTEWGVYTVVGWLLGQKAADKAHHWLLATHLVDTGASVATAARIAGIQLYALQRVCDLRSQVATSFS